MEKPAKSVQGFLLYSPFDMDYFFRVYDPTDKSKFKDYALRAEDIEIEVIDSHIVLIESEDSEKMGKLDYSAKVLGKCDTSGS